jgi:hypothetical protein
MRYCGASDCKDYKEAESNKCRIYKEILECGIVVPLMADSDSGSEVTLDCGVRPAACTWQYNPDKFGEDTWETGCGEAFLLIEGVPSDNKMKFCCYCGGSLIEKQG